MSVKQQLFSEVFLERTEDMSHEGRFAQYTASVLELLSYTSLRQTIPEVFFKHLFLPQPTLDNCISTTSSAKENAQRIAIREELEQLDKGDLLISELELLSNSAHSIIGGTISAWDVSNANNRQHLRGQLGVPKIGILVGPNIDMPDLYLSLGYTLFDIRALRAMDIAPPQNIIGDGQQPSNITRLFD